MIATGPMADRVTASGEHFAMRRSFAEAWARRPDKSTRKRLVLVGRPASLSMVGLDLWRALGPTFAHLVDGELDPNKPGPALEFWDRAVVRLPRPEAPRDFDWFLERSDWRLTAHGQFRYLREERPNSVFWIDRELVAATCMYEAADKIVLLERAVPCNV